MNNGLNRKYFIISLIVHLIVFFVIAYFVHSNRINKTFVVFGAHSQKPSHAIMKFGSKRFGARGLVPFVSNGKTSSKKISKAAQRKHRDKCKVVAKKLAAAKKEKKEDFTRERSAKIAAIRSGVRIKKEERAARKKEEKRREFCKAEERLAKKEEQVRLKQIRLDKERLEEKHLLEQARKIQVEREHVDQEKSVTKEIEHSIEDVEHVEHVEDKSVGNGLGEKIFAESNQDIMEFNLLGQSDEDLRVYQHSIQREVARLWRPPLGVPKGTTCRIMITLGRDGSVELAEFVTHSKMLIYDLSILRIAKLFKFDECLWGKRFTIDFCQ